jgi:flagellar protein FlaJ
MTYEKPPEEEKLKKMKKAEEDVEESEIKRESIDKTRLQNEVIKRIKKRGEEEKKIKEIKPKTFVKLSNKFFSKIALLTYNQKVFRSLRKNLVQANLPYLPVSYISMMFMTALITLIGSFFVFTFFMFFSLTIKFPLVILYQGDVFLRFMQTSWIVLIFPLIAFFLVYSYPIIEKNYIKGKINQELPFVAIHLSAIAGSMVEPSKMFEIVTLTKEYPVTSKEFRKIINDINVYGYNIVSALRNSALNTASMKLAELLNGVSTTITSGGDLEKYFEKKAQSLLFEYRLEREKYTRMAETFMDIYISVVIAAPMILMLLLMMIKISGLGIQLTTQMLTLVVVASVTVINIIFITLLQLKQPDS